MCLKNKRILITAGPTWVPVDSVRVISNTATGETGVLLAKKLIRVGAKVTLLLGPINPPFIPPFSKGGMGGFKTIRILRFKFFDELKTAVIKELKSKKYDVVIHSAAVSDYKPQKNYRQKIKSGINKFALDLVPTPKIINLIKKIDKRLFLAAFKFETEVSRNTLLNKAKSLLENSNADLVVANTASGHRYRAYIIEKQGDGSAPILSKNDLSAKLVKKIGEAYGRA